MLRFNHSDFVVPDNNHSSYDGLDFLKFFYQKNVTFLNKKVIIKVLFLISLRAYVLNKCKKTKITGGGYYGSLQM